MLSNTMINLISLGVLFILIFLASLGLPGALVWMVSSGALANNFWELISVMLTAALAAIIGDLTAYGLAKKFSSALSRQFIKFRYFRNGEIKARELFKRYGFSLIFFTRFAITGLCHAVSYVSGFEMLDRKKFLVPVVLGEMLYGAIYPLIGFIFKETWNDFANVIGDVLVIAVLIIVIIFLIKAAAAHSKRIKNT